MSTELDVFAGRTAVVTGASSGIGRSLTKDLIARGARVIAVARRAEKLRELASEAGESILTLSVDVADERAVDRLLEQARAEAACVDLVVNNAAVGYLAPFLASERSHWEEEIGTNLVGSLLMTRAFLPAMLAAGRGLIINVGSASASGWPYMTVYAATKAALHAASMSLDREYSGQGVRVLSVEVGPTAGTEFGTRFDSGHVAAATAAWTALGIEWSTAIASPEESAGKILRAIEAVWR
jgi:3-hydroxy acid dehydrogenase/malonic semialdehyde reductase